MLPPPTLSFTIPSVQDDLVLCCRIYHPTCLAPTTLGGITEWRKKAAIVAHPYAPLGGCYDDPVVDLVASIILKQGFVVGTFNFRGAGASKGKTSWQSKPEQNDYISFIGFMIYYIHHLSPPAAPENFLRHPEFTQSNPEFHDLSPIPSQVVPPAQQENYNPSFLTPTTPISSLEKELKRAPDLRPCLILAGYSYGALITCSLPPIISSIIAPFQTPPVGSAHAEIRLRAHSLASQQNNLMAARVHSLLSEAHVRGRSLQIEDHILSSPKSRKPSGVRMGGEEDLRRASHESHRSRSSFTVDSPVMVRKSIDRIRSIGRPGKDSPSRMYSHGSSRSVTSPIKKKGSSSQSSIDVVPDEKDTVRAVEGITDGLQVAYLLISPLQGWINTLATMWSSKSLREGHSVPECEMKFTVDPTLALFGDDDVFVSVKKLRSWAEKLASTRNGKEVATFRHREISGAGHFWHHHDAVQVLRQEVKEFVVSL